MLRFMVLSKLVNKFQINITAYFQKKVSKIYNLDLEKIKIL